MKHQVSYSSRFNFKTSYFQKLYKFNEIFDSPNNINFNGEEWAYLYIFNHFKLVIPCKLILEKYYLSNKQIKNILYSARSQELYSNYEFLPACPIIPSLNDLKYNIMSNYILKINYKKKLSLNTIKFLAILLYDKRILNIFNYHFIQKAINKDSYFKTYFPYIGDININADILVIGDIHIVVRFDTVLPNYVPYIFYSYEEPSLSNNYKKIKLTNFKYYKYLDQTIIRNNFHKQIIQYLSAITTFKLIEHKINQNVFDYPVNLKYPKYMYCIDFSYTLVEYKKERILIIYFLNEDYLNRNFIFKEFYYLEIDEFISFILHFLVNEEFSYEKLKKFVEDKYNIKFYPFNVPMDFFSSRSYKVGDLLNHIRIYLDKNFEQTIDYFSSKSDYKFKKEDIL